MSNGAKPYYKEQFERLRALREINPAQAHQKLRQDGIRLFYAAVEAGDLPTAHQLLDWGVFADRDEERTTERWLATA